MNTNHKFFYLIELQFLGFRYHGWQLQKDVKTTQFMVDRTLNFIFEGQVKYKTLGSSRTDKMVSAQSFHLELFCNEEQDSDKLQDDLNKNLPQDIKCLSVTEVSENFEIISPQNKKEYHFYFSWGAKAHPYSAPFIFNTQQELDLSSMKIAAKLFVGSHSFHNYCFRPEGKTNFRREIFVAEIIPNTFLTANFFPQNSFCFRVQGSGFLHHQVRLMMGALLRVGKKEITIKDIEESLTDIKKAEVLIAPASGLHLFKSSLSV